MNTQPSKLHLGWVPDLLDADVVVLLVSSSHDLLLNLLQVDVGDLGVLTVKDLGDLLECGSTGLDVEDGDKDEFKEDPAL